MEETQGKAGALAKQRRGQREPQAKYDGLKLWGAILLKDTQQVGARLQGGIQLCHHLLNDLLDAKPDRQAGTFPHDKSKVRKEEI